MDYLDGYSTEEPRHATEEQIHRGTPVQTNLGLANQDMEAGNKRTPAWLEKILQETEGFLGTMKHPQHGLGGYPGL